MNIRIKVFLAITLGFAILSSLSACHINFNVTKKEQQGKTGNLAVKFVNAYNAHDADAMLTMVHQDVRYMFINNDQIYTETVGKNALAEFLGTYFIQNTSAQSEVVSSKQEAKFIHQVERAIWKNQEGKTQTQCSLSVYELQDELIINVWYFTAYRCAID